MARSIYFSFDYQDVSSFRANVVRNSWLTKRSTNSDYFHDRSMWEEAKRKGPEDLKRLINTGLIGTSVNIVLIGSGTYLRRWVKYEIIKSFTSNKGIIPIYINRIRSRNEGVTLKGPNPLNYLKLKVSNDCKTITFYELVDRKWSLFKDLPSINNRLSNSVYFENIPYNKFKGGKEYKFSEIFEDEYDWITDDGYNNITDWVEDAADFVDR